MIFTPLLAQLEESITTEMVGLGAAPYWVLAGYLLMLLGLGYAGLRRSRTGEEDYYLASRGQKWLVSSLTIMATFFSSFALLGAPGMVYREGLVFALFALNVPVAGLSVYLLGARIWKLGRRYGFVTPGDMVSHYYGGRFWLRLLVAVSGVLYAIPYVVIQIQAGGLVSQELFEGENSFTIGAIVLALITMVYIMIGGMRSVAWTDVVQGVLLITGMLVGGLAMILLFQGPGEFARRVSTELPESSLTAPGNRGGWPWTMLLSVCLLGSVGSMVQPAQWMRYYSADSAGALRRAAVIFAVVLTACFLFGVMLIGLAGQVVYPLRFEYSESVSAPGAASGHSAPAGLTSNIPKDLQGHFRYQPPGENQEQGRVIWTYHGKEKPTFTSADRERLTGLSDSPGYRAAIARLQTAVDNPDIAPTVHPNEQVDPQGKGGFDSILVVMLTKQMPRVLGNFGALFASLLIIAIMAASMSTADSNLHALSALLTRDVYDQFIRPQASEKEKVWVGRSVIVLATLAALGIVFVGRDPQVASKYDFLQMIAKMGLIAIAFSAQLLPIAIDILFIRKGTGAGAAAGLAAGLLAAFFFGDLFTMLSSVTLPESIQGQIQSFIQSWKHLLMHGSVWGLIFNIPVFVLVSLVQTAFGRGVPAKRKAEVADLLRGKEGA